jgi:hypothetical protein
VGHKGAMGKGSATMLDRMVGAANVLETER